MNLINVINIDIQKQSNCDIDFRGIDIDIQVDMNMVVDEIDYDLVVIKVVDGNIEIIKEHLINYIV